MGSKNSISVVFFLLINIILLATAVSAFSHLPAPTPTAPKPQSCPPPSSPPPQQFSPHPLNKRSNLPPPPPPKPQSSPPTPRSYPKGKCAKDTLKLGVCANLLGGLVSTSVGTDHHSTPCCTLIKGLVDLEAAVCLCTAIKAHVLHTTINLDVRVSLKLILNTCGKKVPSGFNCVY